MKAAPFAYARAESVEHALDLLADAGEGAKLLAGGQSLVPLLVHRALRPTHLVDIDHLQELAQRSRGQNGLMLGALTRHADLERMELVGAERLLSLAAAHVGHLPIRSRGTLGGTLAHADPAAELPLALLTLDATVIARSRAGSRSIPISQFFLGPFTTLLAPDEMVTAVVLPPSATKGVAAFSEVAVRRGDFALAAAAATATVEDGRLRNVRITLGAVEAVPVRIGAAEALLENAEPTVEAIAEAAAAAASSCDPIEDRATSARYRRALVARLVRDVVTRMQETS